MRLKCHSIEIWEGLSKDLHLANFTLPSLPSPAPSISHSVLVVSRTKSQLRRKEGKGVFSGRAGERNLSVHFLFLSFSEA